MQCITKYDSLLGQLTLASDGKNITGLWIEGQKYFGMTLKQPVAEKMLPVFEEAIRWLDLYFAGKNPKITFGVCPEGTEFQKMIWCILCEIPYGKTITYGEIARLAATKSGEKTMSAQAVGGAVGHNPVSVIIPCHRVVGSNGSLTGYAGGIQKKRWLLELEGVDVSSFSL